ncbi:MAG: hypothetical protein J1F04_01720 [Oscillospiraceae bacterium]|nr:hypothetical protein [Oscillospiraceae bacterium]
MREILFRGKRVDNGEWIVSKDVMHETIRGKLCLSRPHEDWYAVDPDTLGECTGLRDKNGTPIFEGDICSIDDKSGIVKYDESEARFFVEFDLYIRVFSDDIDISEVEVIGNIYDNPRLLSTT